MNSNQMGNNKHDLDDEIEETRNLKKVKRDCYVDEQQYSNGDDLIEEDDEEDIKQDDQQDEPLNFTLNSKNQSDDDDNLGDVDES